MDIKNIRVNTKMSQKGFAEYFNIPVRTLQDWEQGRRIPANYTIELIKYKVKKERLGMLKLIIKDHGEEEIIKEGTLGEIVEYLQENEDIMNWVKDKDPDMELPNLDKVESVEDLEYELDKIDLDWWSLKIE